MRRTLTGHQAKYYAQELRRSSANDHVGMLAPFHAQALQKASIQVQIRCACWPLQPRLGDHRARGRRRPGLYDPRDEEHPRRLEAPPDRARQDQIRQAALQSDRRWRLLTRCTGSVESVRVLDFGANGEPFASGGTHLLHVPSARAHAELLVKLEPANG